jgi:hypothetical protein
MICSMPPVNILLARMWCLLILMSLPLYANASMQIAIDAILEKADMDLDADRLMKPENSNAVDRYRAVLLLDKANQRAALGLRKVAERYIVLAGSLKASGEYDMALSFIASAEAVNGKTAALTEMKKSIDTAKRANRLVINTPKADFVTQSINPLQKVFPLNPKDLSARNNNITRQLAALAERVQESKEYVLIYARNDAEGRWVYQQMRKSSVNYRLRGNIVQHQNPRVVLDKPLD